MADSLAPGGLTEDIEDLKAQVRALTAQVKTLTQPAGPDAEETASDDPGPDEADDEEHWQFPPFILLLDSPDYEGELRALVEWVEGVLVPGYLAEASADARWCHRWTDHPIAVARLHALWLAWQELTDPATSGYTGPSVWHRDHYDPCMRELRASTGSFQGCVKGEHQVAHRMPALVPSAWTLPVDSE
ncbi:DUF4913 domain-containing protein [Streptomyces sp. NBC_01006]|uniref:DUF4913 domain-containing protein n=1 Tax=Streptomyces sp. NBC_01006 TaxID=2903716 RepID=UPI002F91BE81|nr:DUF4913 domain-containing protein [Streptomyces sp. NBC_01006]